MQILMQFGMWVIVQDTDPVWFTVWDLGKLVPSSVDTVIIWLDEVVVLFIPVFPYLIKFWFLFRVCSLFSGMDEIPSRTKCLVMEKYDVRTEGPRFLQCHQFGGPETVSRVPVGFLWPLRHRAVKTVRSCRVTWKAGRAGTQWRTFRRNKHDDLTVAFLQVRWCHRSDICCSLRNLVCPHLPPRCVHSRLRSHLTNIRVGPSTLLEGICEPKDHFEQWNHWRLQKEEQEWTGSTFRRSHPPMKMEDFSYAEMTEFQLVSFFYSEQHKCLSIVSVWYCTLKI